MISYQTITHRLETLHSEYEQGKQVKHDLTAKLSNIDETLLRISGAIQVLEELMVASQENVAEVEQPTATGVTAKVPADTEAVVSQSS
jgi:predicted  nucleic acid-binding Zn-ribbon protein